MLYGKLSIVYVFKSHAKSSRRTEIRKTSKKKPAKEVTNYTYFLGAFEIHILPFRVAHATKCSIQFVLLGREPFWIGGIHGCFIPEQLILLITRSGYLNIFRLLYFILTYNKALV